MDSIKQLLEIDIIQWIYTLFIILSALIAMITLISKFCTYINKPLKWFRGKNEDHELLITTAQNLNALQAKHEEDVQQFIRNDEMIKHDLKSVSDKMDGLSGQIASMQKKMDETEMAKLKDSIVTYYNKYKDVEEWNQLESDAFWDLFKRYEAHGGNGFVHSIVEPVMMELNVID